MMPNELQTAARILLEECFTPSLRLQSVLNLCRNDLKHGGCYSATPAEGQAISERVQKAHDVKKEPALKQKIPEEKKNLQPQKPIIPPSISQEQEGLRQFIAKTLPSLHLCSKATQPLSEVAILCFSEKDLPFLKSLASAIQRHLAPVKLLKGSGSLDLSTYKLILLPKDQLKKQTKWHDLPLLFLENCDDYEKNPEKKKELWNQLCLHLK